MAAMIIDLATPGDFASIARLFASYPYKAVQRAIQRLDPVRLQEFYAAGLRQALRAGWPHWVARGDNNETVAAASFADDPWHSGVYGRRMGKIAMWLNHEDPHRVPDLLNAVEGHARQSGCDHLSVRIDGEDFQNLHLFERAGWLLVDVSLKFSLPMPLRQRRAPRPPAEPQRWRVELAQPADHAWIRRIGASTHEGTHWLNDPSLPAEKTRELFAQWIDKCIARLAYRIYVLRDGQAPAGEDGRGFVIYLRNRSFAEAVGRAPLILDYVLLDPAVRGRGLGPWFIEESLARESDAGFDFCELRTSSHNLPAVTCYEKLGFRCCASDFVLHKTVQ